MKCTFVKKIHLYSSLLTVTMLIMYIITSFMMMHHDHFKIERQEQSKTIGIAHNALSNDLWKSFLEKHGVHGRLIQKYSNKSGDQFKKYENVGSSHLITLYNNKDSIHIKSNKQNLSGKLIGFHKMRGYGGPFQYNIFAFLLDLTAISLILFAITGVFLWMNILKNDKIAWAILVAGFLYVSVIITYLIYN